MSASHDIGKYPVVFGSMHAMQALENVCGCADGQGGLMHLIPVSTWPQTGFSSLVQPFACRDSGVHWMNANRPPPRGSSGGGSCPAGGSGGGSGAGAWAVSAGADAGAGGAGCCTGGGAVVVGGELTLGLHPTATAAATSTR